MAAYEWLDSTTRSALPENAVRGGTDKDGSAIYVGLAEYEGDELPCKVIPARSVAYVAHGGKETAVQKYKLLIEHKLNWVSASNGDVPHNAVPAGKTKQGETLYVGRASHEGALIVGKVHPSHRVVYIPFGFKEHPYSEYEVLVLE